MSENMKVTARKTIQNIRPYTPGNPIWELQIELGLLQVIKLASNENPLGPSPKALEAIQGSLADIHRYPDAGALKLKQVIASKLDMRPEQLILTNGGDELITLISETFLEPGDEIIVISPSFSEYEFGAYLMGASVISVPLGEQYTFDLDAIIEAVTERTKMICLCSPNNPTGTYLPKSVLHHLIQTTKKHDPRSCLILNQCIHVCSSYNFLFFIVNDQLKYIRPAVMTGNIKIIPALGNPGKIQIGHQNAFLVIERLDDIFAKRSYDGASSSA